MEGLSEKTIMVLPALFDHTDLIRQAKLCGYKVIACDNQPGNPGHKFADLSFNISLLDTKGLLECAKRNHVDAIMGFSTDIGALSAAKVNLNLFPENVFFEAVNIMANKKLFRKFLKDNGFKFPKFQVASVLEEIDIDQLSFPCIIKPIDRAGSKGVRKVQSYNDLIGEFSSVISYSFEGKVIIEDFIESDYGHIHGDGIVQNKQLLNCWLGDQFFGQNGLEFSPVATVFPSGICEKLTDKIKEELRLFISKIGYKDGGLNIEVRIDKNQDVYFIEIAPRFGGNYIANAINEAYGVNIFKHALDLSLGLPVKINWLTIKENVFQFSLRTQEKGLFKSYEIVRKDNFKVIKYYNVKKGGDFVCGDEGPGSIISVFVLKAINKDTVTDVIQNTGKYFKINVDPFGTLDDK